MDMTIQKLRDLLKTNGYSLTTPRIAVFNYLKNSEPVAMSVITAALSPAINRSSMYRTIGLFEDLGIVHRHAIGWKYKIELSDMFAAHHHHLTCLTCGSITAINEKALEQFIDTIAGDYHFQPSSHQVEIQGYCSDCSGVKNRV